MGKFHHSKKYHGDKKKSSSSRPKYDLTQPGRKKLPEDFLYTHKTIKVTSLPWDFSNFLDERFQKKILARSWTRTNRKRKSGLGLEDNHLQTSPTQEEIEAQYFDKIKKLAARFNRATVLVLKHTNALTNLDMHQFLNSDPNKRLDPETKYRRLRQYFSERWGPHSSLDVAKIKSDLASMQGDDPGWRKYQQPNTQRGHKPQLRPQSTPRTSSPVS